MPAKVPLQEEAIPIDPGETRASEIETGPASLDWTAVVTATSVSIVGSGILLGGFGMLRPLFWLGASVSFFLAIRFWYRGAPSRSNVRFAGPSVPFSITLGGLLLGRTVYSLRNPPADWDSVQYHLPLVAHWIQSATLGVPFREPPAIGTFYPGNGELLQTAFYQIAASDTLVTLPGIAAYAVLALAVRELGILLGARPAVSEVVALVFVSSREMMALTLGTRIDVVFAAWLAIGWLSLVRAFRSEDPRPLRTGLLALGLACGTKGSGPALVGMLLLATALTGHGTRLIRRAVRMPGDIALAGLLGAFWMIRNTVFSGGNPLFPFELQVGGFELPGLVRADWAEGTSQIGVWRDGHAGHLRLGLVNGMYGVAVWPLLLGAALATFAAVRNRTVPSRKEILALASFATASFALFLVSPFSGAYAPAENGKPPGLNWDNLRYLLPTAVAMLPLAAVGLSRFPQPLVVIALGAITLAQGFHLIGHVGPGVVLAAAFYGLWRLARHRSLAMRRSVLAVSAALGAVAVGFACIRLDAHRERITDFIWDGYARQHPNVSSAILREIRSRAPGRPLAVVGPDAWWGYYGRDLSGRPIYVPVGAPRNDRVSAAFEGDLRARPDRSLWARNLEDAAPAFIIVGPFSVNTLAGQAVSSAAGGPPMPIERLWCEQDTARFTPAYREGEVRVYSVRGR